MTSKAELRAQALAARAQGGDQYALTRHLNAALAPYAGQVLAGYWPIRDEADPRPAMAAHQGQVVLPVVIARAQPLVFRLWQGQELVPGPFGTAHPAESQPRRSPTVLIVPVAGFDRWGNRLGYGGGFYDRTLEMLRKKTKISAIGLAFSSQELPEIPTEATDQPLDLIVTDHGVLLPSGRNL